MTLFKGVAGRGSRTKGRRGGVRPKAEKKKVTPTNLRVEVVSDLPRCVPVLVRMPTL